jgi:serine/threonine protein kinase
LKTQCGTQEYVAPEVLEHRPAYDVPCDVWALGVMIFIMLGGYYPFRGTSEGEVLKNVRYGQFKFRDKYWKGISQDAKDLIKRMLVVDPNERITAEEALRSSWIQATDQVLSADLSDNMEELKVEVKEKLQTVVKRVIATNRLLQTTEA